MIVAIFAALPLPFLLHFLIPVTKEASSIADGQFLPIDLHSGRLIKPSGRGKSTRQPVIGQGEIEIELRTPSGAELRIRGIMDSLMVSSIIASSGSRRNV